MWHESHLFIGGPMKKRQAELEATRLRLRDLLESEVKPAEDGRCRGAESPRQQGGEVIAPSLDGWGETSTGEMSWGKKRPNPSRPR